MPKEYLISDFGAIPNVAQNQTICIQAAIDQCFRDGGGEVVVPEGKWRTGGIVLRSNVTLHLLEGAQLEGSREWTDYLYRWNDPMYPLPDDGEERVCAGFERYWNALIFAADSENISIIGESHSTLDGRDCVDPEGENNFRGPHGICMSRCSHLTLRGYTVKNAGNFAHCFMLCRDVIVSKINVLGGYDGVDFLSCENAVVEDCDFMNGDDCIAGHENENVTVRNCLMNSPISGFRFSGVHTLIEHCRLYGPAEYPHRFGLSWEERFSNASVRDKKDRLSTVMNVGYQYMSCLPRSRYPDDIPARKRGENSKTDIVTALPAFICDPQPCDVTLQDMEYQDVHRLFGYNFLTAYYNNGQPLRLIRLVNVNAKGLREPAMLYGDGELPVTLEITDSEFEFAADASADCFISAVHYGAIRLKNVVIRNLNAPLVRSWSESGVVETQNLLCADASVRMETSFLDPPHRSY